MTMYAPTLELEAVETRQYALCSEALVKVGVGDRHTKVELGTHTTKYLHEFRFML